MKVYKGNSISGGIAIGKIQVYDKTENQVRLIKVENAEAEILRCRQAVEKAEKQLAVLYEKAVQEVGEADAEIFKIHQMMLQDSSYRDAIENIIRTQEVNTEYAVAQTADHFGQMFASLEDDYMRGRAADVRDISERLVSILQGKEREWGSKHFHTEQMSIRQEKEFENLAAQERFEQGYIQQGKATRNLVSQYSVELEPIQQGKGASGRDINEPVILAADDLAPSEVVQLDRKLILAIATVQGSVNSHAAILARAMGIPAVTGIPFSPDEVSDGKMGIVDGTHGMFYVEPDEETSARMEEAREKEAGKKAEKKMLLQTMKGKKSITLDGQSILLYANIGSSKDLAAVQENDADGVGLFRTECIYLERDDFPTEEEQFQIYRTVAETMCEKRVIIRTFDIGADKRCDYFKMEKEENPALGCRAIRICLARPEIFKVQLRALFRASAFGKIAIMYPMITSVKEVQKIREIVEEVKGELTAQCVEYGEPEQGIMIETPAAAIISDQLAKEVDFFSIGTNDLTQYLLAVDRQNPALDEFCDIRHPAILRMIELVVKNAHKAGIRVGICGELGADPALTRDFLAMGVDELSVSPGRILPLRKIVLETDVSEYRENWQKSW